jgi:leucyl-tRNA synthetase
MRSTTSPSTEPDPPLEIFVNHLALPLPDPQTPLTTLRCHGLAKLLDRMAVLDGRTLATDHPADPAAALARIATAAGLTGPDEPSEREEIRYVPSAAARERVGSGQDGTWPQSSASRHRKTLRRTPGAVFTFPLEEASAAEDALKVFTTDWSPTPAGCAVAVHPGHPLSDGLSAGHTSAFTGRYCRHPLTGDLLPVWTASWVAPEFGTGAVLVNPGHDATDLAFAREIGLPIRFALAPAGREEGPEHWPSPPVTDGGRAVRTGATDGLDATAAQAEYLRMAAARGLAAKHTDVGAGSFAVAVFASDGPHTVQWDSWRRTVSETGRGVPVRVSSSAVLAAVEPAARQADLCIVAPSSAAESELLALRLLLAEPHLGPLPQQAPDVVLVGPVVGQADGLAREVLELAVLTGADPRETLALKAQQTETAQRFLRTHAELVESTEETADEADTATLKAAAQIKAALRQRNIKQAFTHLYRMQKSLAKSQAPPSGALTAYEALAHVLAGLPGRRCATQLTRAWQLL